MRARRTRRKRHRGEDEQLVTAAGHQQEAPEAAYRSPTPSTGEEPLAAAGPNLTLDRPNTAGGREEEGGLGARQEEVRAARPGPVAQGQGTPHRHTVQGQTSLRLEGRTDADYDGGSYHTTGERLRPTEGCEGCAGSDCVRVTGTLVATYRVTTTVTLPSADDYPDLTPCQRRRVQAAIRGVLAPHEQEHVRAFRQYNGTTRRRFDLTLCRSEFDTRIRQMFEAEEAARRQAAQSASDDLDPFHFDVSLDCEDEETGHA